MLWAQSTLAVRQVFSPAHCPILVLLFPFPALRVITLYWENFRSTMFFGKQDQYLKAKVCPATKPQILTKISSDSSCNTSVQMEKLVSHKTKYFSNNEHATKVTATDLRGPMVRLRCKPAVKHQLNFWWRNSQSTTTWNRWFPLGGLVEFPHVCIAHESSLGRILRWKCRKL